MFQINGEDVSQASHEHVVNLIRKSGDLVQMMVVTPAPVTFTPHKPPIGNLGTIRRGCQTLPRKLPAGRCMIPLSVLRSPAQTMLEFLSGCWDLWLLLPTVVTVFSGHLNWLIVPVQIRKIIHEHYCHKHTLAAPTHSLMCDVQLVYTDISVL